MNLSTLMITWCPLMAVWPCGSSRTSRPKLPKPQPNIMTSFSGLSHRSGVRRRPGSPGCTVVACSLLAIVGNTCTTNFVCRRPWVVESCRETTPLWLKTVPPMSCYGEDSGLGMDGEKNQIISGPSNRLDEGYKATRKWEEKFRKQGADSSIGESLVRSKGF